MTFEEFAARKTEEAANACLPPYLTDYERPADGLIDLGNDWTRSLFDGSFYASPARHAWRPASNVVFVQSLDGNTAAANPGDLGGGETDKHLIYEGLSRVAADAVMAGAETIRGGGLIFSVWHPELVALRAMLGKPRHPVQVVATLRGLDLAHGIMFNTPGIPVVIITVKSCMDVMGEAIASRPWIETIAMERASDLPRAFEKLRQKGVERLSCVGGRQVATELLDAALVDDVYVTTASRAGGEPNTPMYPRALPQRCKVVRKRGTGPEHGVLFQHYAME